MIIMKKIIIIKYGELTTKHDNINFFIKCLKDNIDKSLDGTDHETIYDIGRMFIKTDDYDKVVNVLTNTFGIHEINVGYELDNLDLDDIESTLFELLSKEEFKTFKVETKRSNKKYPLTSM